MRRLIVFLICLFLTMAIANGCIAENAEDLTHNYILIIDNSRSTTGRHSLGGATDPNGLRFDAARLVYDNVVSSGDAGGRGQIGVIIFCGPENCVSYGPMDINADAEALDQAIGRFLNEEANQDHRDNYTDIKTALESARSMMAAFDGQTSVILLTDGVNDLTNGGDPFSDQENIEANDQSVEIAADLRRLGADFHVIALSAQDAVRNTDAFMEFINRMASAGGGQKLADGSYGNVLMATQTDLNSKLLQMLIRAESTTEATIQNDILSTGVKWPFTVPYKGINDATVNLTFMPEDKARIEAVELSAPDGKTFALYDREGPHPQSGIAVKDERSYIILDIPAPQPGEWSVVVTGKSGGEVPINTVVRFNHKLRLHIDIPDPLHADTAKQVSVWFQQYNGKRYEDLKDSDIYKLSNVTLTLLSPDANSKPKSIALQRKDNRFTAKIKLKTLGTWLAEVSAENEYWADRVNDITFEVAPKPTPSPTPTATPTAVPTATPTAAPTEVPAATAAAQTDTASQVAAQADAAAQADQADASGKGDGSSEAKEADPNAVTVFDNSAIVKGEANGEDFYWQVDADAEKGELVVSWEGNGADDAEAELVETVSNKPVVTGLHSGDGIDVSILDPETDYTLLMASAAGVASDAGAPPVVQALDLQLVPDADAMGAAMLNVAEAMVKLSPADMDEESIKKAIETAKSLQKELDTLVDAFKNAGEGGTAAGQREQASGSDMLPADYFQNGLTLNNSGGDGSSGVPTPRPSVAPTATPTPTTPPPTEAPTPEPTAAPTPEPAPTVLNTLKANWFYLAGGVALLVALGAVLVMLKDRGGERVTGNLKITCEEIKLEMLLRFEGSGSLKVGSPLTQHPNVAKLKGGKVYDVLSHLRVSMTKADQFGMVAGSDVQHLPNDRLIRVTCVDPRTREEQAVNVGKNDLANSELPVYDAGRIYTLIFTGSMSFDELVYAKK